MKIFVQVLGTDTGDSTPSLWVFYENKRYLINCGEGTQRFCTEHGVRLGKLESVFLTRLSWHVVGGLPGLLLTVSDMVPQKQIRICGPQNTFFLLQSMRYFFMRPQLEVNVTEATNDNNNQQDHNNNQYLRQWYNDENLSVVPIAIFPSLPNQNISPNPPTTPQLLPQSPFDYSFLQPQPLISPQDSDDHNDGNNNENDDDDGEERNHDHGNEGNESERISSEKCYQRFPRNYYPSRPPPPPHVDDKSFNTQMVVCYAFHTPDVPGKFMKDKAVELGIPPGPLFGKLSAGEVVISPKTGLEVRPDQVICAPTPSPIFLVIDCPSEHYLYALQSHPVWKRYTTSHSQNQPPTPSSIPIDSSSDCDTDDHDGNYALQVEIIFHFTPLDILSLPQYQSFLNLFSPNVKHIYINESCSQQPIFRASTSNQSQLHALHPLLFPPILQRSHRPLPNYNHHHPQNHIIAKALSIIHLQPTNIAGSIHDHPLPLTISQSTPPSSSSSSSPPLSIANEDAELEIVFLGTGAALPSKYRNVSAIYVRVDTKYAGFMMDCGEGTLGQLYRRFGEERCHLIILNLKLIIITHIHADHHLGMIRLLEKRMELERNQHCVNNDNHHRHHSNNNSNSSSHERIIIIGPHSVGYWLEELSEVTPLDYIYYRCFDLHLNHNFILRDQLKERLKIFDYKLIPVIHCNDAYGLVLQHPDWKIVYSGDTRPCRSLIRHGYGATILIHEATFESEMKKDAIEKRHSTTEEAIRIGKRMKAKYIILSHFSQRYPKIPKFNEMMMPHDNNILIAFDFMSITIPTLPSLPPLLPAIAKIFEELSDVDDDDNNVEGDASSSSPRGIKSSSSTRPPTKRSQPNHSSSQQNKKLKLTSPSPHHHHHNNNNNNNNKRKK